MFSNMKAVLLLRERHVLTETAFVELVVWQVPQPVPGSAHDFNYSLALVVDRDRVVRYDNQAGKGDHKRLYSAESTYRFVDVATLQADFWADVEAWEAHT